MLTDRPVPEKHTERIHALIYDLAELFVNGEMTGTFSVFPVEGWYVHGKPGSDFTAFYEKWTDEHLPGVDALKIYGYVQEEKTESGTIYYSLTANALALLDRPALPPSIFISYARKSGAAFGLLIAQHLRQAGVADAFIDMQLESGESWLRTLEAQIKQRDYLIALIAPGTLERPVVRKEIRWALDYSKTIVPVWHGEFTGYAHLPAETWQHCEADGIFPAFSDLHAISVENENALGYDTAITQILNRFGYTRS